MTNREECKFLVIDDLPSARKVVTMLLNQYGYELKNMEQAADGQEAWDMLNSNSISGQKPFDLIIADWKTPNMTGIELLKKVREDKRFNKIPFIMITSNNNNSQVIEAASAGVTDYISKPFSGKIIGEKIDKALKI